MGVIETKAQSIDRNAMTFKMFGAGSIQFLNAVKKAVSDIAVPKSAMLTANEVQEWIEDDVDSTRCELLNNNVNVRWNNAESTTVLTALDWTVIPWTSNNFTAGGMYARRIGLLDWKATANKCGVYSVYCLLEYTVLFGDVANPKIAIFKTQPDGTYSQWMGDYLDKEFGNKTGSFVLQGSDLVYLDCGDSIDIRLYIDNAANIIPNSYDWDGYVAISYQGNQY